MDAILLVLRTGMQWNALNATGICSSSSAHRRFQEWEQAGGLEIWRQGLLDYDEEIGIDWAWLSCDGATGKAPRHLPPRLPVEAMNPTGHGGSRRDDAAEEWVSCGAGRREWAGRSRLSGGEDVPVQIRATRLPT